MVAEAKDAMAKEVKQEHRKHMEAYGVEEDDDDTENDVEEDDCDHDEEAAK